MPYGRFKNKIGPHRAPTLTTKAKAAYRAAKLYKANAIARKVAAQGIKLANAKARAAFQRAITKPTLNRRGSLRL